MQKADIAAQIHQQVGISKEDAAWVLDWILGLFKITLQTGEPMTIPGFGKFTVRQKHARQGRNPITGEALMISPRRVVTFHASPILKRQVNTLTVERQEDVA